MKTEPQHRRQNRLEPNLYRPSGFAKTWKSIVTKPLMNPRQQNVSAYMYLQRVMLDKAEKFAAGFTASGDERSRA